MPQEQINDSLPITSEPLKKKKFFSVRFLKVSLALCVAALIILGGYFFIPKGDYSAKRSREYSQSWRLVPEKVSKSAPIRVYAPAGMTADQVAQAAKFDPEIPGKWVADKTVFFDLIGVAYGQDGQNEVEYAEFQPAAPLTEGLYYGVKLALADGNSLSSDFLVAEDPKIDTILPKGDMEAPEDSKITIVFNRPMVALSTADSMEPKDLPVALSPKTAGKWKWISTNTLQFIPEKTLKISSTYSVKVNSGLKSLDGLEVAPSEASFETRNLRYSDNGDSVADVVYNEPYRLYFNQPVDLEKTVAAIKIFDNTQNKNIEFTAEYKKNPVPEKISQAAGSGLLAGTVWRVKNYLSGLKASIMDAFVPGGDEYDKSVIEIYAKKDKYGRAKFWNTNSSYSVAVDKAYPVEGDIIISDARKVGFASSGLISAFAQVDGRSDYNGKDMFDPKGRLAINFYEPVDIGASTFMATIPITKKEYGQKCDDPNFDLTDTNCNKVDDTKVVLLTFDAAKSSPGQTILVRLEKVVNFSGTKVNGESLEGKITVYPVLDYRVAANANRVELDTLTICSNNPLQVPDRKDFDNLVASETEYEIFSWGTSWRRDYDYRDDRPTCNEGEFETNIGVGLVPSRDYRFALRISDVYGQTIEKSAQVATGPMENNYVGMFAMQQEVSVTTPGETKLTYGSKNITYADAVICKLGAYDFYRWQTRDSSGSPVPSSCLEKQTQRIEIGERYWLNNYFDLDITQGFANALGSYVVVLSHPQYTYYDGSRAYQTSYVTVTGLSAAQKAVNTSNYLSDDKASLTASQLDGLKNIYWVSNMKTLVPVSGANVTLYSGSNVVGKTVTDSRGVATLRPVAGADLAIVDYNGDSTVIAGYDTRMNWANSATNVRRAYLYSDRPIYRPGDKVNIKGILRLGYDGNYQMWENTQAQVTIRDPRWETAATIGADLDDFGAFTAEYTLDSAAALGNYEICVDGSYDCASFSVKEYVAAAYEVTATTQKEEYVSKDKVKVEVGANYYFGVPVANAEVEYTISSQNYYFHKYREGGYNFGYYEECETYYCYGDKFIGRGTLTLDKDGKGVINETIDLQKISGGTDYANSRIVVFDITATNSMGQSISAQKSVIVHAGQIYLGAKADPSFTPTGKAVEISALAVDTEGKISSARDVKAAVYSVDWVYAKRLEAGGSYNYDWTRKRDLVTTVNLDSKGNGKYSGSTAFAKEGEYEIDITGGDNNGNTVMSRDYVYVYGGGVASIRLYDDSSLTLKAQDDTLDAGQQGSLIIESPFAKAKALVAIERGKVFKYDIVDIDGSLYNYTFDAVDEYAPNVFVSVLLQSTDPAVKFGSQEFTVNSDEHKITVDVSSDKKTYKPGDSVVLNLSARDDAGKPVAAEISVAVADLSVLALAGNPKKDPLIFFYDGFPLTVSTSSSIKEVLVKVDKDSLTKGGSGGGANGEDDGVRGEFRDTAFWRGSIITDSDGNARLEFKLPDNLTTWQAEAVAVTKDTKLGAGYAEFMSRNDLMVVPVKPRFIVPGDEFYVAAQVFNQSEEERKIAIDFASDTLQFIGNDKKIESKIKPGESKTVYFKVMAPLDQTRGIHTFTISADGGGINDAVRQTIPVKPNLTYEAVATANYVTAALAAEAVYLPANVSTQQGELTVRSSATLAVFLSDALNYFIGYPYGCTEQISSRLKAMAAVKAGLNVPNLADKFQLDKVWVGENQYTVDELINIGLAKVYKNQNSDGGFGLWESSFPNFYTTLEAVEMLKAVKAAGIDINQDSLDRALGYLSREFSGNTAKMGPDQIVAAAAVLADSGYSEISNAAISNLLAAGKGNGVLNDQLSNKSLAQLAIMFSTDDFAKALDDVNAVLDNRITIDSRGAFLQSKNSNDSLDMFETTTGNTALYLRSLAAGKRDTEFTDKVVRWILNSRDKDGAWGSTQNTLGVVMAFTDYLNWKKETEAEFTLATLLNGGEISTKDFNASSILDQSVAEVAANQFKVGQNNIVSFTKKDKKAFGKSAFYYDMGLKYYLSGLVLARDEGFSVARNFYAADDEAGAKPLVSAKPGDVLREHLEITIGRDRRNVAIEDFIPAGMEIVDMELATEQKALRFTDPQVRYSQLDPDYTELRDDRAFIYVSYLDAGTYEFDYYVRALAKGEYLQLPCVASEFYNPENFGRTASSYFDIK